MAAEDEEREQTSDGGGGGQSKEQSSGGSAQGQGHESLARELDAKADDLEQHSQDVGRQISETRDEWERKQASEAVPGAVGDPDRGGSSGQTGATETETNDDE
jgi:hypothetical protein